MATHSLATLALLAFPPVVLWVIFWRRRLAEPEPTHVLVQLFFFGLAPALPLFALRGFDFDFPPLVLILIFALLEESLKALALIFSTELNRAHFDKWEDGFEFALIIALGFAFAENIFYFWQTTGESSFWAVYIFRSLGTVLAHTIFTGTFGYFYATAYVAKEIVPLKKHEKPLAHFFSNLGKVLRRPLHITIFHLLPRKDSAHGHTSGEVVLEGFLLAVILHAIFNALLFFKILNQNLTPLVVPILLGAAWWYATRFRRIRTPAQKSSRAKLSGRASDSRLGRRRRTADRRAPRP
ncbi:MAG: PrsW family glutamic-type intramembrane protease [Patescibacteria group bacterium]